MDSFPGRAVITATTVTGLFSLAAMLFNEFLNVVEMRQDQTGFFKTERKRKAVLRRIFDDQHGIALVFGFGCFGHGALLEISPPPLRWRFGLHGKSLD